MFLNSEAVAGALCPLCAVVTSLTAGAGAGATAMGAIRCPRQSGQGQPSLQELKRQPALCFHSSPLLPKTHHKKSQHDRSSTSGDPRLAT